MRGKRLRKRWRVLSLSVILVLAMAQIPVNVLNAEERTEEEGTDEEKTSESEQTEQSFGTDNHQELEVISKEDGLEESEGEEVLQEESLRESQEKAKNVERMTKAGKKAKVENDPIPDKSPHLVYGDQTLSDADAFVLLVLGDGFTKDQQTKFYEEAKKTADYVMATSPWDEFKDTIKIYALGVVSNESGAKADKAINQEQADADQRDTYFGSAFWSGGMQRLLTISSEGAKKANELVKAYLPAADFNVVIVNAETYGGSGGNTCVASLNSESLEMMLHELGHTTAGLADEYFAGASYAREYVNMTAESDPDKVKWKRFLGKNGIGVYEYDNGGDGWYRPHENCKMRFLGKQYAFCEVCKEEIRRTFCVKSDVTKLFFQPYADMFYEADIGKDMKEYFIIRRGSNQATGDQLGDKLQLTYRDEGNNVIQGIPSEAGTYTIEAKFVGDGTYAACTQSATYTIELPDRIKLDVKDKVYDGEPAKLEYQVDYEKEYSVKAHYTGTIPYAAEITYDYDSDEAPIKPGRYTVTLTAYDKETDQPISKKSKDYTISFKSTALQDNNTSEYPGAQTYYNNKTIVFTGEGFTADEQAEFESLAKEYVNYFQNTEPYKEANLYFNYHTVEAVSEESGIGRTPKDTYFKLTYDDQGKIVDTEDSTAGAMYIGNNVVTSYYKATIVIVNDKNVKEGSTKTNKRFTVYATPDKTGMKFAANELLNYFTSQPEGYEAKTEEQKEEQRIEFLKALYYTWYGSDYAPILSRAYNEEFVENGKPIDLAPYFHTYILGREVDGVEYKMTYYAEQNGGVGMQLDEAPSKAGTYYAKAELILDEGKQYKTVVLKDEATSQDVTYHLPLARGWTMYTILSQDEESVLPEEPDTTIDGEEGGNKENLAGNAQNDRKSKKPTANSSKQSKKKAAGTGDNSLVGFYFGLWIISILGIGVILYKRRKNI